MVYKPLNLKDNLMSNKCTMKIDNTTDLIKGVILKTNEDLLINKSSAVIQRLKQVMAAVA